ncbi:Abi family protein [Spirulina major CS-329]|uniref:Abi family protein n=1 Tax=Spirulina TaxID=1154 RepID=UPI00232C7937|nr:MULTISPECIES: Abi family protein [Spirulina]MDB9494216.1 Abi family protein [Spirulina subsalsa CS-330]MDB9503054.1 Abi family protein [Spirulina major CS-329]
MQYQKPSLSFREQIERLQARGLIIENLNIAEETLARISYYRLSAYTRFFQDEKSQQHQFKDGSKFEDVIRFYEFDKSLRMLVFNAIESIEVAVRTQVIYHYSQVYGSHWYLDQSLFKHPDFHQSLINEITEYCQKKNVAVFVKHYRQKYSSPMLPPCYMALETISFGKLSKLLKELNPCDACQNIYDYFGLTYKALISWLHSLCYIRNICAHHARLLNIYLPISPSIPNTLPCLWLRRSTVSDLRRNGKNDFFIALCVIQYLLNAIKAKHHFSGFLHQTLAQYPSVPIATMGFPEYWCNEPLWNHESSSVLR